MAIDTELRTEIERAVDAALAKLISPEGRGGMVQVKVPDSSRPVLVIYNVDPLTGATLVEEKTYRQSPAETSPAPGQVPADIGRLVRVVARAVEVLGTSEKALRWIKTPVRSLGDRTPLSLLDSPEGLTSVEDALGRIEHGVW